MKSVKKIVFDGNEINEVKLEGLDEQHARENIKQIPMTNYLFMSLINK